ncbi:hypothetical protein QUF61_08020 [Candidatus Venteria ishoeyi]|uniref:hypothetical protein n=1 Tax=Candidatus Venteria ishoeyi TaxID=1899563 RepID=UPI0025A66A55|nr:hypothetical protein [Candidatus Venteria ishoeyi]MDM8546427.1 hypothetical protein [Candidatus Venteria ishoeyi]
MDWIIANKEWLFSGLGLIIFTSIASVFVKAYFERKKQQRLNITTSLTRFSLPADSAIPKDSLKISYKNKEHENLASYKISICNVGQLGIDDQSIVFLFPKGSVVDSSEKVKFKKLEPTINTVDLEENTDNPITEMTYLFSRLEPQDLVSISFLLNLKPDEKPECSARGTDAIPTWGQYVEQSDLEKVFLFISVFILIEIIPGILAPVLQALLILYGAPFLSKVITEFFYKRTQNTNNIVIDGGEF